MMMGMMTAVPPAWSAEKSVKLATLAWEPYVGPDLPNKGYAAEVVTEAFKRSGYTTDIRFYPWARAVMTAEHGESDGIFPEYFDERRKQNFVFSDPFPGGPVGLYKRRDTAAAYSVNPQLNPTEALRGLQDFRFGIVRGYINTVEFDNAAFLRKEEVFSDELNLKKLYNGRIQFMFIDKLVAEYLTSHKFPEYEEALEFMEPPLEYKMLYIAFSRQTPAYQEKLAAFNAGLQQITSDGTLARIMKQHGIEATAPSINNR
jgi:ABC-type amino acid transport substrate-binding protein